MAGDSSLNPRHWAALRAEDAALAAQARGMQDTLAALPEAVVRLDRAAQMVEQSTVRIMDECDRMRVCGEDLRAALMAAEPALDADLLATLESSIDEIAAGVVRVYEQCNFQDLNAQAHGRAMAVLSALQAGLQPPGDGPDGAAAPLQQDEIDALLRVVGR